MDRSRDKIVRIVSEGTANDTHIFLEGGSVLDNVYKLALDIEVGHVTQVELWVHSTEVDVKAGVRTVHLTCPICKEEQEHTCGD